MITALSHRCLKLTYWWTVRHRKGFLTLPEIDVLVTASHGVHLEVGRREVDPLPADLQGYETDLLAGGQVPFVPASLIRSSGRDNAGDPVHSHLYHSPDNDPATAVEDLALDLAAVPRQPPDASLVFNGKGGQGGNARHRDSQVVGNLPAVSFHDCQGESLGLSRTNLR